MSPKKPKAKTLNFLIMASASAAGKSKQSKSDPNRGDSPLATAPSDPNSSPAPLSRYESQMRRDWITFLQYLGNQKPPITPVGCSENHVLDYLRYLDQFGKTKVHLSGCPFFCPPKPTAPCACPVRQAWASLDALIQLLRSAYEEHGGQPESNPFAGRAVRVYLREVSDLQAKPRGIPYKKKDRKRPTTVTYKTVVASKGQGGNAIGTGSGGDGSGSDAQTTFTGEGIGKSLIRKQLVWRRAERVSKDNEPVIDTFQKALPEHHNPDTLKKLNDAEKAKRELEQQQSFDTKLANEEHEKEMWGTVTSAVGSAAGDEAYKHGKELLKSMKGKADNDLEDNHEKLMDNHKKKLMDNHEKLMNQAKTLYALRDHILTRARTKVAAKEYEAWISRVKQNEKEVQEIETEYKREEGEIKLNEEGVQRLETKYKREKNETNSLLKILCDPIKSRRDFSERMARNCEEMQTLWLEGNFKIRLLIEKLPERVIIIHGLKTEDKPFLDSTVENIQGHQRDKFVERIGLWGGSEEQIKLPQEVFDIEKLKNRSGQTESQIEDVKMEPKASEQCGLFLMRDGLLLTLPPKDEDWETAKEIYLMDNKLSVLPENPRCPVLSALFLLRNYKLRRIPPSFFDYMPALQVLNLSRTGIKSLPDSIVRLISLKRLFLNNCHCFMTLSPKVGELKQLEVLDLEGTEIMDLPEQIKKLTNLTCLEVSFYGCTNEGRRSMPSYPMVPYGIISALSQLEELNIDVNPDDNRWDACVEVIFPEVCNLMRLTTLKFYFPKVELLSPFLWNSPMRLYTTLTHFRITVGGHVKRFMSRVPLDVEFELERWERCLKYVNGVGVPGDIKKVLQRATAFFLDRHATVKKLSSFGIQNMENLKCCVIGECNEVQVIIDETDGYAEDDSNEIVSEIFFLGSLEYMYMYCMKSLRSIWEGPVKKNSLFLLKSLTLCTCPQLTIIFTQGLLDNLCNLEELKVEDCPSIKSIVSCKISAEHRTSYFLPNLKRISLHYMPGLVNISNGLHIAPKLEWLSFYNCPDLKNPLIDEISSQDLKKIKGEKSWWEALDWSNSRPSYLEEIFVPIDIWDC